MKGKLQPPLGGEVRVVVERREIVDDEGERDLLAVLAQMLDRRRHSRRTSGG